MPSQADVKAIDWSHNYWILCLNNSFATRERNGLLLYNGRYNERHDFIALELIDGRLQFSFSLGANLSHVLLEQPYSLADGDWHTVTIDYFNRVSQTTILIGEENERSFWHGFIFRKIVVLDDRFEFGRLRYGR